MKILVYAHAYQGHGHNAGGEVSLHALSSHLTSQGHEVLVLVGTPTAVESYVLDGVPVHTVRDDQAARTVPMEYVSWADVVLTQLSLAQRGGIMGQMLGKPVIHYAHNNHPLTARWVQNHSDIAIFNSEWVKEDLRNQGVWTPGPVLHPVVDPSKYEVKRTRAAKYITLVNLSMDSAGAYDKGHATFFELARRNPDLPFLAVRGAYGEQAYECLPNVTYMPHQSDIREVLKKTKVLLVPSKTESYGRIAVEAAASGIPSVMTDLPGPREAMYIAAKYEPYGNYDAWNERLHLTLTDYARLSELTKERSQFLWEQSQLELREVSLTFEILASGGLAEYYDYYSGG